MRERKRLQKKKKRTGKQNSRTHSLFTLFSPIPRSNLTTTGKGSRVGGFAADISRFYLQYHAGAYAMPDSMFLHDPTALAAVVAPHLFTWLEGPVVVCVGAEERGGGRPGRIRQPSARGDGDRPRRKALGGAEELDRERVGREAPRPGRDGVRQQRGGAAGAGQADGRRGGWRGLRSERKVKRKKDTLFLISLSL